MPPGIDGCLFVPGSTWSENKEAACSYFEDYDAFFRVENNVASSTIGTASFKLNVVDELMSPSLAFESETAITSFLYAEYVSTDLNALTYAQDTMSVVVASSDPTVAQIVKVKSEDASYDTPAASFTLEAGYIGIKILKAGTATISATYAGGNSYTTGEASYTLTVIPVDVTMIENIDFTGIKESYA